MYKIKVKKKLWPMYEGTSLKAFEVARYLMLRLKDVCMSFVIDFRAEDVHLAIERVSYL